MAVINRIKAVLAEKQLTDKWLAEEIGKSENTISKWCSNKVQPSLEVLLEIATLLSIDIRELPYLNETSVNTSDSHLLNLSHGKNSSRHYGAS